jgi:hypothetical protein
MANSSRAKLRGAYTIFEYHYRDAGNFKAHGAVLLRGSLTIADRHAMECKMESQEYFIAEQVGIKPLYEELYVFSKGATSEDHVWHCFDRFFDVTEMHEIEGMVCWGGANDLRQNFEGVERWNLGLSPHAAIVARPRVYMWL